MKRKKIVFLLTALWLFTAAYAQEKISLTLEQAKEYALQYNLTIKNSGLTLQQAQERLWETISAGLPQLEASTNYSNAMGAKIRIQFQEDAPPTEIPIKPTSNFNLQVGQLIFNGSYLVGIQTAKLYKELSGKNLIKTEEDVIGQVIESYYLVLISKESLRILTANMENLKEIYRKTEPMVRVGMMEKVELDQLSVQVSSLENALKASERQNEMTKNLMRLQLGVSAETQLELTDSLGNILEIKEINSDLARPFELSQNIDYQLLNVQQEMTEKQVDLQKAAYLPTLSGYYSYTYKILKPAFDMSPPNMVGLQMSIPIFSSGERRSKVRQAKIDLETTKNNKALLENQLNIQFKQLRFNLLSALESFNNQKKNVEVSREVYKSLRQKYEQGMISSLELTTADNNYLRSESDYLTAMLDVLRAQNNLVKLLGEVNK